jgi:hypothetical protein
MSVLLEDAQMKLIPAHCVTPRKEAQAEGAEMAIITYY